MVGYSPTTSLFVTALVLVLVLLRIVNSPFGRVLQAIRENEFRAEAIGYRVVVYRTTSSVLSALFATLAGAMLALWLRQQRTRHLTELRNHDGRAAHRGHWWHGHDRRPGHLRRVVRHCAELSAGLAALGERRHLRCRCCRHCSRPTAGCCGWACCSCCRFATFPPASSGGFAAVNHASVELISVASRLPISTGDNMKAIFRSMPFVPVAIAVAERSLPAVAAAMLTSPTSCRRTWDQSSRRATTAIRMTC